ncbi:virus tail fibre assembly protein, lambda gpK [Pantoea sesami]|nr:virus tail fibre assembly protein, lambda gpK [Pantoea sesami]
MKYALIDESGVVQNVFFWDGETELIAIEGYEIVPDDGNAFIGGTFENGVFSSPVQPQSLTEISPEHRKEALLASVREKVQLWGLQYQMGILKPDDEAKLKAWLVYAQEVESVDVLSGENYPQPPSH